MASIINGFHIIKIYYLAWFLVLSYVDYSQSSPLYDRL